MQKFPDGLKLADVKPVFKKNMRNSKTNYRPVSILSNVSKLYDIVFMIKYIHILKPNYQNTNAVLEKDLVHNIVLFRCLKNGRSV